MRDLPPGETRISLHARIRQEIAARIRSGEWRPGDRIPTEHELEDYYRCSRATVNKALSALAAEGMVVRNRRAGTVVAHPRVHSPVLSIPDIQAEIETRGSRYGYRCLVSEVRPACCDCLGDEGLSLGESRFISAVHTADDQPMMLEDRHIFLEAVPHARTLDFTSEPPSAWLVAHVPWTEASHRIAAVVPGPPLARKLSLSAGEACLLIERRTWRGAELVTFVRQWFRGDRFDLTASFRPPG